MLSLPVFFALADPYTEAEFEQLRNEINKVSSKSPSRAISKTNDILAGHVHKLTVAQQIRLLYGKAWFQIQTDDVNSAIDTLSQCKLMSARVSDPTILFSYYSLTAGAFSRLNMYERALENYLSSYHIAGLMDTEQYLRQTENNIGNIYLKLGRYEEALDYFTRFYQDAEERQLPSQKAVGLNNIGEAYFGLEQWQKALSYHLRSLQLREAHGFTYHSSWSHHNLGRTYMALQQGQRAEYHLRQAIDIRRQGKGLADSIAPQIDLARLHIQQKDSATTLSLLNEAIDLSTTLGRLQEKAEAYQLLREYHKQLENWQKALDASDQYMQSKFDLLEKQAATGVAFYAAQMNMATKEKDIVRLTQENELHKANTEAARTQLLIVIISVSVIALLTTFFILRIRSQNRILTATLGDLKHTQKQLLEAEKMSAMTTLVSGMAHQLNTPLGLVVTSASCLEDKLSKIRVKLTERQLSSNQLRRFLDEAAEMLTLTARNSARAADMIARFKTISASLDSSESDQFEVLSYLRDKLPLLRQSLPVHVEVLLEGDNVEIFSHPEVLLKVISQLLDNSCSHGFSEQDSPRVTIYIERKMEQVIITYRDNGAGISKDKQQQIFDPFYTSQLGQGKLGLGLNIIYNAVVHVLKGELSCEDASSGACFVIRLPVQLQVAE
ncbi:tetratricopeptide repeat protein [Lacimicrobium alkaliphilum]|uniref:histidine kinase n=1 Tax=Lacimicrobium alkaliphilum TaxID=1526571 RepID=A0ABQ1RCU6_9ALTE|nr:tetratricopeptide repeat protein [Lacimicrobium alkaliphilum]GGD66166.1 hypothetical protein GCM10011357_21760 [Lacimicrobium alkaliphilum]